MRILLVEDDAALAAGVRAALHPEGYTVDCLDDGPHALQALLHGGYELAVLDLGLPRMDGLDVLRQLRASGSAVPVLVLTARDATADRIAGLDAGADDYLVKPFALDELQARVRALARRARDGGDTVLELDGLQVDTGARRARWRGVDLQLSPKEYALLELLLRERGKVLSRPAIFDRLYDSASESSDKVVEVILSTLRGKLAKAGAPDPIRTRRGFGYVIE